MRKKILLLALIATLFSCTENKRAKNFGGKMTIEIKPNYRVVNATWKGSELWYFIEPMDSSYTPVNKYFIEKSTYSIFDGKVEFIEKKVVPLQISETPYYLNR